MKRLYIAILFAICAAPCFAQVTFDQYGGLIGQACPARGTANAWGPNYSASVSSASGTAGTLTVTLTAAKTWYQNDAVIIAGAGNAINTPSGQVDIITAATPSYTTSPPSSATFTITTARANGLNASSGTVTWAAFYWAKVTDGNGASRWVQCTPLGNVKWVTGAAVDDPTSTSNRTFFSGVNGYNLMQARYGNFLNNGTCAAGGAALNLQCNVNLNLLSLNFNTLTEAALTRALPIDFESGGTGWQTSDSFPPPAMRIPYLTSTLWSQYSYGNVQGFLTNAPKALFPAIKTSFDTENIRKGGLDSPDPLARQWWEGCLQSKTRCLGLNLSTKYHDYQWGVLGDESDEYLKGRGPCASYAIIVSTNSSTPPYLSTTTCAGQGEAQPGLVDFVLSPYESVVPASVLGGSRPAANLVYPDQLVHLKQTMCDWFFDGTCSGTALDNTTGVSASGNGSVSTYTGSFDDGYGLPKFIAGELISVIGCSPFDTPSGASDTVTIVTATTTSFTTAQSVSGTAAGCTVFAGPNYTVTALNTAWGSSFTQAATAGTFFAGEAAGSGDGTTLTFSHTASHLGIAPCTLQVFVGGVLVGGDYCDGPRASSATQTGHIYSWGAGNPPLPLWTQLTAGSSIDLNTAILDSNGNVEVCSTAGTIGASQPATWSTTAWQTTGDNTVTWTMIPSNAISSSSTVVENTGVVSLTFSVAPPTGTNNITISYEGGGGWGLDHAFVDEDGVLDAAATWMPPLDWDVNGTRTQTEKDLDNFFFYDSKLFIGIPAQELRKWEPSVASIPPTFGGSGVPPMPAQSQVCNTYCGTLEMGALPINDINSDITDDQARIDFVGKYYNGPWYLQVSVTATPESYWKTFPGLSGPYPLAATQTQRATFYSDEMTTLQNAAYTTGTNSGVHPVFGLSVWSVFDDGAAQNNFGIFDSIGDLYDGVQATSNISFDALGYQFGYYNYAGGTAGRYAGEQTCSGTTFVSCTGQPFTSGNFTSTAKRVNFSWVTLFKMQHVTGAIGGTTQ